MNRQKRKITKNGTEVFLSVNADGELVMMSVDRYEKALKVGTITPLAEQPKSFIDDSGTLKLPSYFFPFLR